MRFRSFTLLFSLASFACATFVLSQDADVQTLGPPGPDSVIGKPQQSVDPHASLVSKYNDLENQIIRLATVHNLETDAKRREEFAKQLRDMTIRQFELRLQYEQEEIALLATRLEKAKATLKERSDGKSTIIDQRVSDLTSGKAFKQPTFLGAASPSHTTSAKSTGIHDSLNRAPDVAHTSDARKIALFNFNGHKVAIDEASLQNAQEFKSLGTDFISLSDWMKGQLKKFDGGLLIVHTHAGGPLHKAGVLAGDILVGVDKWSITSFDNLKWILDHITTKAQNEVRFYIVRNGKTFYGTCHVDLTKQTSASLPSPSVTDPPKSVPTSFNKPAETQELQPVSVNATIGQLLSKETLIHIPGPSDALQEAYDKAVESKTKSKLELTLNATAVLHPKNPPTVIQVLGEAISIELKRDGSFTLTGIKVGEATVRVFDGKSEIEVTNVTVGEPINETLPGDSLQKPVPPKTENAERR